MVWVWALASLGRLFWGGLCGLSSLSKTDNSLHATGLAVRHWNQDRGPRRDMQSVVFPPFSHPILAIFLMILTLRPERSRANLARYGQAGSTHRGFDVSLRGPIHRARTETEIIQARWRPKILFVYGGVGRLPAVCAEACGGIQNRLYSHVKHMQIHRTGFCDLGSGCGTEEGQGGAWVHAGAPILQRA